jgi:hypothetical protein
MMRVVRRITRANIAGLHSARTQPACETPEESRVRRGPPPRWSLHATGASSGVAKMRLAAAANAVRFTGYRRSTVNARRDPPVEVCPVSKHPPPAAFHETGQYIPTAPSS